MHFTHKNIVLILISALIVGGAFMLAEYRNSHMKKVVYSAPVTVASADSLSSDLQNIDSDKDGLKDWEESLLGTDSHKADTDGDGTPDGKEVSLGRNPLVKGPNDTAKTVAKSQLAAAGLSPTDKMAREFFSRYMELNQNGLGDDKDSQALIINEVLQNGMVVTKPKSYESTDILINNDSSNDAIKQYANEVGSLIQKYNNTKARNELIIAKEALEKEDYDELKEIDPIIASYKNIMSGLFKISVPQPLANIHLTLINSFNVLIFSTESVRKLDTDPLSAVEGSSIWLSGADGLNKSFNDLKAVFVDKKITFQPGEGGTFFVPQP
jgi:hypothetical protein